MTETTAPGKSIRSARRDQRYAARNVLWLESSLPRVRRCGLGTNATQHDAVHAGQVKRERVVGLTVTRSEDGNRAGFSGVETCGSTWACPVCAEKIQAHRQAEVAAALARAREMGWHVGFLTFTVRHSRSQSLAAVWGAVSGAWRATVSGSRAAWETDRTDYGVRGYLRLTEVTHGFNGWHVHVHALVFLDPAGIEVTRTRKGVSTTRHYPVTVDYSKPYKRVQELGDRMGARWRDALNGTGFRPSRKHGHDSRLVTSEGALPDYFAKNLYHVKSVESAAHDVTGSHAKQAKRGNVTPFGILARVVSPEAIDRATGELKPDARDLALWREWERESKGKRQLLWSNGLRDLLGLGVEVADEDVEQSDALGGDVVVNLWATAYRRLARSGRVPLLLDAVEADPTGRRARDLLLCWGVGFVVPDRDLPAWAS